MMGKVNTWYYDLGP
jgi:sphingomyelin phosphodiesterase